MTELGAAIPVEEPAEAATDGMPEMPEEVKQALAQTIQVELTVGQAMIVAAAAATFVVGDSVARGGDQLEGMIQVSIMSSVIDALGGADVVSQAIQTLRDAVPDGPEGEVRPA